ncbi:unnamed protein product [Peniophora sp. CBMAI 1063]|nr:unnamed protein product [Peniophora sp. CBMAI 1063]
MAALVTTLWVTVLAAVAVHAQDPTWCGKVYMNTSTVVPPGGQFPTPASSSTPLLALRCSPALIPFLPDDVTTDAEVILVDALVRYSHIAGAEDLTLPEDPLETLDVTVSLDGNIVANGTVALNGTASLPFSLEGLMPRIEPYTLSCAGSVGDQTFSSTSNLTYLPTPSPNDFGNVAKRDLRTGGILAKATGSEGAYEAVFPFGFYTNFGGYLESNDTTVEILAEQGFNMIHPVPTYDNHTALLQLIDKMEELGLWMMYDMRWTYMNLTDVSDEVSPLRSRTNVLTWYTGDEPDGTSDPLNATTLTYDLLKDLDPYRPVSLVLNCQNYFWTDYSSGTDVILQDVYEVGNNVTFSSEWFTPCTEIQGDCGCDNCKGSFEDIRDRVTQFRERMEVVGWERSKTVWTVPQGFGGDGEYWARAPTGAEWLIEAIVGVNAGAFGVVSWNDPTTPDIKASSSALAKALPAMVPDFILSPKSTYTHVITDDRLDLGVWTREDTSSALVLAANLDYFNASVSFDTVFGNATVEGTKTVFDGGATADGESITFGSVASGAWIFTLANATVAFD